MTQTIGVTNISLPLKNKTALVTGGSRGIGRAIAERLAKEGAIVVLTYNTNKASAEDAVRTIESLGGNAFALQADLVNADSIPALFKQLDDELFQRTKNNNLDILVNSAGGPGFGDLTSATPESWDAMFAVYARAPFFIAQAALSRLSDGGRIINISSGFATQPAPAASIYSMAKASINTFTHVLAIELGARNITVNAVAPGWTRTDMNATVRENTEITKAIEEDTALGRFGEPSEIAAVVAFLASDEGRWVTAQVIEASGGYKL